MPDHFRRRRVVVGRRGIYEEGGGGRTVQVGYIWAGFCRWGCLGEPFRILPIGGTSAVDYRSIEVGDF